MKLYHGSNIVVEHPEIAQGKPLKELKQELQYPPKITFQYFFGSEKALEKLRFLWWLS